MPSRSDLNETSIRLDVLTGLGCTTLHDFDVRHQHALGGSVDDSAFEATLGFDAVAILAPLVRQRCVR